MPIGSATVIEDVLLKLKTLNPNSSPLSFLYCKISLTTSTQLNNDSSIVSPSANAP